MSNNYPDYYAQVAHDYDSPSITLHHPHEHHMNHHQHIHHPPPSPPIPIDPALALYHPQYYSYQHNAHMPPPHLTLPASLSSPSSQGSETIGTPPTDHLAFPISNSNGKRPASALDQSSDSRKKSRNDLGGDDDADAQSPATEKGDEPKAKPTRGSRACTVCRRLKMKCVGAEQGPPCKRCQTGGHECIFEESNRGKRSTKKHEILTRSLRKMERTLDTVLRSLGNPSITSGMVSRSPSPSIQTQTTQALLASPSPPPTPPNASSSNVPGSPKLHSLPDNTLNPLGLLAEASLANRRQQANGVNGSTAMLGNEPDDRKVGVASALYFKPGPMTILPLRRLYIERQIQPEMLSFVSTEEVVALFKIYFDNMNIHCSLLDPDFHTPSLICSRSPFLLTAICAIASRFYTPRPELHPRLSELTKKLAFQVPERGYKSVEIVQAYLLYTLWGCGPVERFEQDRTWLMLGMAIRMATDLNLHRQTAVPAQDTPEGRAREREVHIRERTWIVCFCLDRSFSAQMGKPYTIKEDFIIRNAGPFSRSPLAIPSDSSLAAYADMQRILTRSIDLLYSGTNSSSGLQVDCDYLLVIKTMETQLLAWRHEWQNNPFAGIGSTEHAKQYGACMAKFFFNYAMLTINSFGLQNALERSAVDIGHFFARCHSSAVNCVQVIRDEIAPMGYLQYAPDSHFVQASYAVLSLLKLLRPEFKAFLDHEQKTLQLVTDITDTFERVAVGPLHTPALYSTFLRALIDTKADGTSHFAPPAQAGPSIAAPVASSAPLAPQQPMSLDALPKTDAQPLNGSQMEGDFASLLGFPSEGEMGPVADMSTFPPTMAPNPMPDASMAMLPMDSILGSDFWDSMLVPGSSMSAEIMSAGHVYGEHGSGLITPKYQWTPTPSVLSSPTPAPALDGQTTATSLSIGA